MTTLKFRITPKIMRHHLNSAVYIREGMDPLEELKEGIWQAIRLDLDITIGGITMFAAAWEDPEHWASDWSEKLGCDYDDVLDRVLEIINANTKETSS